jgi:hypothetical protein
MGLNVLAGGIVAHTADNYPICDWVAEGVYRPALHAG